MTVSLLTHQPQQYQQQLFQPALQIPPRGTQSAEYGAFNGDASSGHYSSCNGAPLANDPLANTFEKPAIDYPLSPSWGFDALPSPKTAIDDSSFYSALETPQTQRVQPIEQTQPSQHLSATATSTISKQDYTPPRMEMQSIQQIQPGQPIQPAPNQMRQDHEHSAPYEEPSRRVRSCSGIGGHTGETCDGGGGYGVQSSTSGNQGYWVQQQPQPQQLHPQQQQLQSQPQQQHQQHQQHQQLQQQQLQPQQQQQQPQQQQQQPQQQQQQQPQQQQQQPQQQQQQQQQQQEYAPQFPGQQQSMGSSSSVVTYSTGYSSGYSMGGNSSAGYSTGYSSGSAPLSSSPQPISSTVPFDLSTGNASLGTSANTAYPNHSACATSAAFSPQSTSQFPHSTSAFPSSSTAMTHSSGATAAFATTPSFQPQQPPQYAPIYEPQPPQQSQPWQQQQQQQQNRSQPLPAPPHQQQQNKHYQQQQQVQPPQQQPQQKLLSIPQMNSTWPNTPSPSSNWPNTPSPCTTSWQGASSTAQTNSNTWHGTAAPGGPPPGTAQMTSSAGAAPPFSSAGYSGGISPSPSGGGSPLAGGDLSRAPASGDYSPAAARQSSWNGMSFPPAANDYGAQRTTTPVGSPTPPFAPPAAPAAAPCAAHPVTPTAAATAVPFGAASGSPAPPPPPPSASPAHPSAAAPAFGGGGAAAAPAVPAWTVPASASSPAPPTAAPPAAAPPAAQASAAAEEGATAPAAASAAPDAAAAAAAAKDPPCAACKSLRRKCTRECLLLPYFPRNQPEKFHVVHKVFGASNVSKMLQDIPVAQREDAVASLEYEAQARLRDPVYGCVGVICLLQKEMVALQEQLKDIEASSLSSSPNATHSSTISGDGAMYGIESSAAAVPSVGAAREEGGEC